MFHKLFPSLTSLPRKKLVGRMCCWYFYEMLDGQKLDNLMAYFCYKDVHKTMSLSIRGDFWVFEYFKLYIDTLNFDFYMSLFCLACYSLLKTWLSDNNDIIAQVRLSRLHIQDYDYEVWSLKQFKFQQVFLSVFSDKAWVFTLLKLD